VVTDAAQRPRVASSLDALLVLTALALLAEVVLTVVLDTSGGRGALVITLAFAPVPLLLAGLLGRRLRRDATITPGRRAAGWTIAILTIGVIVLPILGMIALFLLITSAPAGSF
jgi:hypothetical protein